MALAARLPAWFSPLFAPMVLIFDGKPSCLRVIGATALVTVTVNPALGLVLGWLVELIRVAIVRRLIPERPKP